MQLDELIRLVESGGGADRAIDGAIYDFLSPDASVSAEHIVVHTSPDPNWLPRYTTSLDAVLALIKEKLPGAAFVVHGPDDGWFFGGIGPCLGEAWGDDCSATSPARALLAAALRALKESRHVG